ncbi:MAG: hypothetical protein DRJ47_03455 [Thermoprotei archaeon]|nr:MAG: hypothetical protein DRJ47_03455 [Thermoprotei archaeon]
MPIKVYYAAPMLGDRRNLEDNKIIVNMLETRGLQILTKHVVEDILDVDKGVKPEDIFTRDLRLLDKADILIADVSYPSLGVGFEIAYALLKGKNVYALCRKERLPRTSALIRGISWSNFHLITYNDPKDAVKTLLEKMGEMDG